MRNGTGSGHYGPGVTNGDAGRGGLTTNTTTESGGGGGGGGGSNRGRGRPGGAAHLARIHGTEEDKVNCPFYFKIGACRHADRCSRLHHRPNFSQTILIKHIFRHPEREAELRASMEGGDSKMTESNKVDPKKATEDFLIFFENMYEELGKFGRLEALHVCDNLGDHMIGHVYAKFSEEEEAADALQIMNGRYYDGRKMQVEYSPVTDFREARCRDFDEDTCSRGGFCNFMHIKPVPMCLVVDMEEECEDERRREATKRSEREHREKSRKRRRGSNRKRSSKHDSDTSSGSDDDSSGSGPPDNRSRSRSRSRERDRDRYSSRRGGQSNRGRSSSSSRSRSPNRNRGDSKDQRRKNDSRDKGSRVKKDHE